MEVVTGATSSVLSKLGTLLQEEYYLQKGVKKDVESLQNELIFMRAALCKVAEVPPEQLDTQVKAWAGNIKELSYDMKDAVDTYEVRVAGNGLVDGDQYFTWVVKMADTVNKVKARHLLAGVIAEMKDLTMQVAELRDRYKLDNITASNAQQLAQDIKVSINYQPWTWWLPRYGDIISFLLTCRMKVRAEQESGHKDPLGTGVDAAIPRLIGMKDPVGVGVDMKNLCQWMTSSQDAKLNNVLCILGVGGAGKTTMATALYRKYGDQFDLRATVTASQLNSSCGPLVVRSIHRQVMPQPKLDRNTADIIEGAMKKCCFNGTVCGMLPTATSCLKHIKGDGLQDSNPSVENYNDTITNELKNRLKDRSYLLLIDDVRSEKAWKEISGSLLGLSSKRCIIIVTTRSPAVAAACNEKGSETDRLSTTHKMGSVGTDNGKEIFMEALSESRSGLKDRTNAITNNIPPARLWEMCGDQPVAIIVMAAHVAYNLDKPVEEWKQVCSNLLPDSVKAVARDGVPRILRHCYHDMPAEIKTCFLYLSMYPKGCKISRKHLTRRWIAEGFVEEKPGQSMQEVADDYLDQLIRRKMVQPVEQSRNGKVKNCKVYELVHEFILSMASEENLVTVIVGGSYMVPPSSGKLRRLLSHCILAENDDAAGKISLNMSHVRSLVVFEDLEGRDHLGSDTVSRSVPQPLTSRDCPILQVLDFEGCRDVHHLDTKQMRLLCNMLLLKYLSLRRTDIVNLPREIGKLSKLETLDIRETEVTVLPHTVWHLERLVSLLGGDKTTRPRKAFKLPANSTKKATTMKSLQVLSGIEITEGSLEHLKDLTKLRKLAIYRLELDSKVESMEGLKSWIERLGDNYLHTLVIMFADQEQLIEVKHSSFKFLTALEISGTGRVVVELPNWIKELSVLAKLTLPITALRSDTLDHISLMSSLFSLTFTSESETIPDKVNATIQRNKADSYGEIIVPGDGFMGLKLLRFSAPSVPPLSFLDMAMPNLERLELRCKMLEGLFGIENLKELKEVYLSVHVEADQFTKSLVKNIAAAAEGTRIIRDEYQG